MPSSPSRADERPCASSPVAYGGSSSREARASRPFPEVRGVSRDARLVLSILDIARIFVSCAARLGLARTSGRSSTPRGPARGSLVARTRLSVRARRHRLESRRRKYNNARGSSRETSNADSGVFTSDAVRARRRRPIGASRRDGSRSAASASCRGAGAGRRGDLRGVLLRTPPRPLSRARRRPGHDGGARPGIGRQAGGGVLRLRRRGRRGRRRGQLARGHARDPPGGRRARAGGEPRPRGGWRKRRRRHRGDRLLFFGARRAKAVRAVRRVLGGLGGGVPRRLAGSRS